MIKRFKKVDGTLVSDVVSHTLDILTKDPTVQIHVGTDSQNVGDNTIYVTTIAYRYGTRGVHYILTKSKISRINDLWTRLWKETEASIEVANWLRAQVSVYIQIDMDYNEDKFYKSNQLIQAARGWAQSLGYKVNVKPDIQIATKAADYWCC